MGVVQNSRASEKRLPNAVNLSNDGSESSLESDGSSNSGTDMQVLADFMSPDSTANFPRQIIGKTPEIATVTADLGDKPRSYVYRTTSGTMITIDLTTLLPQSPHLTSSRNVHKDTVSTCQPRDDQSLPVENCKCLSTIVSLLERIGPIEEHASLDRLLVLHKEYVVKCQAILCHACMSKSDLMMLLILTYEKLVGFCEGIVDKYLEIRDKSQECGCRSTLLKPDRQSTVGEYRTDSEEEWDCLIGSLVLYQVKVLGRQVISLRWPASVVLSGGQIAKSLACERRLGALVSMLREQ